MHNPTQYPFEFEAPSGEIFYLIAEYTVSAAVPARTQGPPEHWSPPEPAEVQPVEILPDAEANPVFGQIWEQLEQTARQLPPKQAQQALQPLTTLKDQAWDYLLSHRHTELLDQWEGQCEAQQLAFSSRD